ncbi:hypothetical protein EMGBS15_10750 [Filimonas sp.]|nr:hypothetical protein EMGBS15_10750 [Filimonas sp.]
MQAEQYKSSVLNRAVKEAELKKQVSEVFYLLMYMQQKQGILLHHDSVYASFLEKATLRFNLGESNILEKATAETQRGQIANQLRQLNNDAEILQLQFQLLLNTTTVFIPSDDQMKIDITSLAEGIAAGDHPEMKMLAQQKQISMANTLWEKSKRLPDLNIGFSDQSIRGTGADNIFYTSGKRFQSVQVGVGLPLFYGAQKARIEAGKTLEQISDNQYRLRLQTLETAGQTAMKQYQTESQTVRYFEESALPNARLITQTANLQFVNGDINYLEWTQLINNAVTIESEYAEAIKDLNQTSIQLNYLMHK